MFNTVRRSGYSIAMLALLALALVIRSRSWGHTAAALVLGWGIGGLVSVARAARQRRTATPVGQDAIGRVLADPKPSVAGTYVSLYAYLEHRFASTVVLTFEQVESLLGFALPQPASTERDWWTSGTPHADRHSQAWTVAG